jgi:DNA-binding CsgD family transcriptional regulator
LPVGEPGKDQFVAASEYGPAVFTTRVFRQRVGEAEILYWIGRGKTDPEIARLLSISPRTVQKHIEHIFAKLGVETRTAAVMRSLELVG